MEWTKATVILEPYPGSAIICSGELQQIILSEYQFPDL